MQEEPVSLVQRLRQLAAEEPDAPLYTHVGIDGTEVVLTSAELDRRSSQLAGAMAAKGLGVGDRLALGLRNSPEFVIAAFAGWKLGATPIPVRWDLPDWELDQLREVIGARRPPRRRRPRVDPRHRRRRGPRPRRTWCRPACTASAAAGRPARRR